MTEQKQAGLEVPRQGCTAQAAGAWGCCCRDAVDVPLCGQLSGKSFVATSKSMQIICVSKFQKPCSLPGVSECVSQMPGEDPLSHAPGEPGRDRHGLGCSSHSHCLLRGAPATSNILWVSVKLGVWKNLIIREDTGTFLGSGCCITHASLILQILREHFLILGRSPLKRYRTACSC